MHLCCSCLAHQVCTDYLSAADRAMARAGLRLVDRQLAAAPLSSQEGADYLAAMAAAANYAFANRSLSNTWPCQLKRVVLVIGTKRHRSMFSMFRALMLHGNRKGKKPLSWQDFGSCAVRLCLTGCLNGVEIVCLPLLISHGYWVCRAVPSLMWGGLQSHTLTNCTCLAGL